MDALDLTKGFEGEKIIRQWLKINGHSFGQLDIVSINELTNTVYLWEVKYQERFKAPPFDGHGLPPWQVDFRLKLSKMTNMIPILAIIEPNIDTTGCKQMFIQRLDFLNNLPNEKKITTKNGNRIVFHIDEFINYKYDVNSNQIIANS